MLSGRVRCVETNDADIIRCIQRMAQVVAVVMLVAVPLSIKRGLAREPIPPLPSVRVGLLPLSRW